MWIWAWEDEEDEDERRASNAPPTPEKREVKHFFEDAVGLDFLKYAYESQYCLAEKLFEFALYGMHSNEGMNEADDLIHEWSTLCDPEMREVKAPADWLDGMYTAQAQSSIPSWIYHPRTLRAWTDSAKSIAHAVADPS